MDLRPLQNHVPILAVIFCCWLVTTGTSAGPSGPKEVSSLAFPGAEGFGAHASGGRSGTVYHITQLGDSGPGSFRDAVSLPNRIIVFDLGGIIRLKDRVSLSSNLTIAGQTAPGEGICLYNRGISMADQANVIIRYLRFREGISGDRGAKSLGINNSRNVIIDHCSIEWGRWDDLGLTVNSSNITVQYCLIAEAIHPQSFGALIDSVNNVTLSHNLWMSNESRNPKAKGTIQYINNVVYNWGETGLCGGHSAANHDLDVIGNYFIKGPSSNDRFVGQFYATDHVYQTGNMADLNSDGILNGQAVVEADFHRADEKLYTFPTFEKSAKLRPDVPVTIDTAAVAYKKVLMGAGCSLHRDFVDFRLLGELASLGTKGSTLSHTDDHGEALAGGIAELNTGPTPLDTDRDGIPDEWEITHGLDPQNPADALQIDSSGFSQIEGYINSLTTVP